MKNIKHILLIILLISTVALFTACGKANDDVKGWADENLSIASSVELDYAKLFTIDILENGCGFITVNDSDYYYVVKAGAEAPQKLPDKVSLIELPLNSIYVVGTGSMDFFESIDALDKIKYSSLQANEWQIEGVKKAIEDGRIQYAGKYSAPDYEMLLSGGCDLVVENTMITHSPEVLSQLHDLNFKSIVDYASYEDTVEGRMEWVKLYGYLTGHEKEADAVFKSQCDYVKACGQQAEDPSFENKTVGFFSITAAGTVSIRKKDDYINNMIDIAGGKNPLAELDGIEGTGSTTIQMESFYKAISDCDILIYNGTIEGEIDSIDALVAKSELLANCRAVKNGEVYCTAGSFYQSVMSLGDITNDLHSIIQGKDNTSFLVRLK